MYSASKSDSWNQQSGTAEARRDPENSSGFNLPDGNDTYRPASTGADTSLAKGQPPSVNSVPNGGGGIPGGGGGGAASLGGGGGGGGGAQLGSKADVLHGLSGGAGGSYSATNAAMNMKSGESGGYTYGGGPNFDDTQMNLADFLPGGKQDPTKRNIAGVAGGSNFQIQAKDVNIWHRISERIRARCSQGLLRDCVP